MLAYVLSGVSLLALAACCYALFRNWRVYRFRIDVLCGPNGLEAYDRLPDYDTMMRRFWVWPLSRFLR